MRSKALALAFGVLLLSMPAKAQEEIRGHIVVPLAEGGFVAFKSEPTWAGEARKSAGAAEPQGGFRSQAFVDEDRIIHRVLVDAAGKYIFGYDLVIIPAPASKTFTVAVKPLDPQIETRLLKKGFDPQTRIATLLQTAEPQILDDGDSFALDLLVNQNTGVKIVDLVRVAFDRSKLRDDRPRAQPRDFTLDAVALTLVDYRLSIDGTLVGSGKPGSNFAGALIWFYVENHGRFIFSLVPRDGYQFEKAGIIEDNKIEFTIKGRRYEWLSSSPILPNGGTWNVWVLHDPKYLPFGSREAVKKEPNKLEQLDKSINAAKERATKIGDPSSVTFQKPSEEAKPAPASKRFKVMVGAADSIENLWPRSN